MYVYTTWVFELGGLDPWVDFMLSYDVMEGSNFISRNFIELSPNSELQMPWLLQCHFLQFPFLLLCHLSTYTIDVETKLKSGMPVSNQFIEVYN